MIKEKISKFVFNGFFLLPLLFAATDLYAQKTVNSGAQTAGFVIAADNTTDEPVIHYQRNISMLAGIDDVVSLSVFASGRVHVHYPIYMKKAGDYEMQLDDVELTALIQSLSAKGLLDFNEKAVKEKIQAAENAKRKKGELLVISDAVETVVDIRLDEFQKNKTSKKITKFHKQFKWKNIEQDAKRHKNNIEITNANRSIEQLKSVMKDKRLVKRPQR
ncbi:MAG: hypothetical protein GQ549_04670 [Gammaproteobacteria bacterium]|nr:hypothetical protein [Gammaproteobacteria bacterium]